MRGFGNGEVESASDFVTPRLILPTLGVAGETLLVGVSDSLDLLMNHGSRNKTDMVSEKHHNLSSTNHFKTKCAKPRWEYVGIEKSFN